MIKKDKKPGKFKKFLYGKSFYAVLAVSVFAVGVVTFSAIENISLPIDGTHNEAQAPSNIDPNEPVGIIVNDIPKETEPDLETEPTEDDSSAAISASFEDYEDEYFDEEDTAVSANPNATSVKPYEGNYMLPVNTEITNKYSAGELVFSKTMRDYRAHNGVDFAAEKNTKAAAVNDGTIKRIYTDPLWGGIIEIEHSDEMISRYCGITPESGIEEGMNVQMGQAIGTVTAIPIEESDERHLHFEVLISGKAVDPLKAINKSR